MKKIIAIIGSPVKNKSNTALLTRDFLEIVKSYYDTLQYEVLVLGEKNIAMYKGCWACTPKCSFVVIDDLQDLQEELSM